MPFCNQCGSSVSDADQFCSGCGGRQDRPATGAGSTSSPGVGAAATANGPATAAAQDWFNSLNPRTASLLCYIPMVGWIGSVIVLATERFRQEYEARFHAFQGLYLFVAYLIVDYALGPMFNFGDGMFSNRIERLMKLVIFGTWIFMLVKTSQGVLFKLPVFGELADRSVSEQR